MWVADLACAHEHAFEGWFASADDFESQRGRGLVSCPVCGDQQIIRRLSAPRLNVSHLRAPPAPSRIVPITEPARPPAGAGSPSAGAPARRDDTALKVHDAASAEALHALYLSAVRAVLAHTEDVGQRFADEARAIHQGDAPSRLIRGQASVEQAEALRDEGIEVLALPVPDEFKGPVH
ncbi:MAG: DUF1178 family protein [Rubrivivax sp.]|nr:MAG: DUF1178 family protein [Rubrivivax sp.]